MTDNHYHALLLEVADSMAPLRPDDIRQKDRPDMFEHWDKRNEWVYAEMANILLPGAYAYCSCPETDGRRKKLLDFCLAFFEELERSAYEGRWYHRGARMGDPNIDRFTLLPLLEAFQLMKAYLPSHLKERVSTRLRSVLEIQYCEYGSGRPDSVPAKLYPNMDVYYCLIMWFGHSIFGESRYAEDFSRYLDMMNEAQFDDGAWTYIQGTNECPVYHDINVMVMSRIASLSGDERALAQVRKSVSYYPLTMGRGGRAEYHTDCWWKHAWNEQFSTAPDIVASMTGDGQNRWIGDQLRERSLKRTRELFSESSINNLAGLSSYYAAVLWQDVTPVVPPEEQTRYDSNIQGPRGHFRSWSWAATARYCSDTLVGALAHDKQSSGLSALMAVTAEIPYWLPGGPHTGNGRINLCVTPQGTCGTTDLKGEQAEFSVTYQMACTRQVFGMEPFPKKWQCAQHWFLDRHRMTGSLNVTSLEEQTSRPPTIRIRFGTDGELRQVDGGLYSYGAFLLKIPQNDFPHARIQPAPVMLCLKKKNAVELLLGSEATDDERNYAAGRMFQIKMEIEYKKF